LCGNDWGHELAGRSRCRRRGRRRGRDDHRLLQLLLLLRHLYLLGHGRWNRPARRKRRSLLRRHDEVAGEPTGLLVLGGGLRGDIGWLSLRRRRVKNLRRRRDLLRRGRINNLGRLAACGAGKACGTGA
jgi:hypothetical protein